MTAIPDEVAFWGLDSGVRHAVTGSDYGSVRVGAFMGYRIIAESAGLKVVDAPGEPSQIDDPRWGGYLANITPSEFERRFAANLPERDRGGSFPVALQRHYRRGYASRPRSKLCRARSNCASYIRASPRATFCGATSRQGQ